MVPWPIALLTLGYGVVAAVSSATVWKAVIGPHQPWPLWPSVWLAISAGAMIGLALLKPWGRMLAIVTSIALTLTTLAIAARCVSAGQPVAGLLAAFATSIHLLTIRYLQRPTIKRYFEVRIAE